MDLQVKYQFSKMELAQFALFDENFSDMAPDIEFHSEAQFSFDKDSSVMCCRIVADLSTRTKPLVRAELKCFFLINPESLSALRKDDNTVFPPQILVQFASLCYGSLRGVIFAKTLGSPLNNYVLPPVYFGQIIDKAFIVN